VGPDVSRLLDGGPQGLTQLTFPDGAPPQLVDWVDYIDRVNAADTRASSRSGWPTSPATTTRSGT
jgi:hypothetical protein